MNKENIEALLKDYQCPYMGTDLVSGNAIKEVKVEGNNVYVKCVCNGYEKGLVVLPWRVKQQDGQGTCSAKNLGLGGI